MKKLKILIYYSILTILPIEIAILLGKFLGYLFVLVILISFLFLQFFYLQKINKHLFMVGIKDNLIFSVLFLFLFFFLSVLNTLLFDGSLKLIEFVSVQVLIEIYSSILFLLLLIWSIIYMIFGKTK